MEDEAEVEVGSKSDRVGWAGSGELSIRRPTRRKEIHGLIQDEASCIRDRMERCGYHAQGAAWRRAVEQWLEENGLMTVHQPQIVLPHSP